MKPILHLIILAATACVMQACTKTESDFSTATAETIVINASTLNVTTGSSVNFLVLSSVNNVNVTAESKVYVNGNLITGNSFTFNDAGNFAVYATKGALTSNVISVNVAAVTAASGYKHHVLVEEYSGTWCGNCPRILYGVDLLHQQTDKAIVVGTHLFTPDPYLNADGNDLAAQQGVSGVPNGFINRTQSWTGPQYENVAQVISAIQASSTAGIAISTTASSNVLSVTVKVRYAQPLGSDAKLTVYLVEDKLYHTQSNYSANLYGGLSSIPNFKYDGVLRKVISAISGDGIGSSGNANEKTYSLAIPATVANVANTRVVAFITNSAGTVVNAQDVKVGTEKTFEGL